MNKFLVFLIFFFLISAASLCQNYQLVFRIDNCSASECLLVSTFGPEKEIVDTLKISSGIIEYSFPEHIQPGSYQLFFSKNKNLDFIYNKESIFLHADYQNFLGTINVLKSEENKYLFNFIKDLGIIQQKQKKTEELFLLYEPNSKFAKKLIKESNKLNKQEENIFTKYIELSEGLLIHDVLKMSSPTLIPGKIQYNSNLEHIKHHWFDNFDFHNELIINTEIFNNKVWEYFNIYIDENITKEELENHLIEQINILISKASVNDKNFIYQLNFLSFMFDESDFERVIIHINELLLSENACSNEKAQLSIEEKLERYRRFQIGKIAPDLHLTFPEKVIQLSHIKSKYKLLLFWASWCPHCIDEIPSIKNLHTKYAPENLEIISISLDTDLISYEDFISEFNLPWINYCDGKGWESDAVRKYDVNETPKMLLLGSNMEIVSKPSTAKQLAKKLEEIIK